MVRKSTRYLLLGLLVLIPGQAFSLGLGDITVDSVLNQPLQAQINLISARVEELDEVRVELAPADVFDRVGIPRPFFLTQLKFTSIALPGGGAAIRVTSKDPVKEPFLTFLVEVTWPNGRLLREYTVLLDPPEFAQQQQQAPQITTPAPSPATPVVKAPSVVEDAVVPELSAAPAVATESDLDKIRRQMDEALGIDDSEPVISTAELADLEAIVEDEPTAEELEAAAVAETVEADGVKLVDIPGQEVEETELAEGDIDEIRRKMDAALGIDGSESIVSTDTAEYKTVKGDTLIAIAMAARGSAEMTVNQMMLTLQQVNPDAFIRDNINLLKTGVVLRIPDEADAQTVTRKQAIAEVSRQNALWHEYRRQITEKMVATNVDSPGLADKKKPSGNDLASAAKVATKKGLAEKAADIKAALKKLVKKDTPAKQDLSILGQNNEQPGSGATQLAGGEELKKLQKDLALNQELAQSRGEENAELKDRVEALESMLEKKDKILSIQSQELEQLQQQLSTGGGESPQPDQTKPDAKPVAEPLPDTDDKPMQAEQTPANPKLEPLPDWDSLPDIETASEPQVADAKPEQTPTESKPAEPQKPKPVQPPAVETGIMATVMGFAEPVKRHWTKFTGGGLAIVAILGLYTWRQKRSAKQTKSIDIGSMPGALEEDSDKFDDILDETIITPRDAPAEKPMDEVSVASVVHADADTDEQATAGSSETPDDVLEETDVYISYGLHQQAEDMLKGAIKAEPDRKDYKVKLAEVYHNAKDQAGFEKHAQSVKDQLGESSSEWQKIVTMGKEIAPASTLFAGAVAAAGSTASPAAEKPAAADVDIGLKNKTYGPSGEKLADTVVNNDADSDEGLDFNIDEQIDAQDDHLASRIMEANETSQVLNYNPDDLGESLGDEADMDADIQALSTGVHKAADITEELEEIGMETTMDDLEPLEMDAGLLDDSDSKGQDDTQQFDASDFDTEYLDPAEATAMQTATDLKELASSSLAEEVGTKLDLAKAFVDMGDSDAAKETLQEVIKEGDDSQIKAAKDIMDTLA